MTKLFIDTSNNQQIVVGLELSGMKDTMVKDVDKRKSQAVLSLIDEMLHKHSLTQKDLTEINVTIGPGSFTGLRVGVTIANTLGTILQIPVNGNSPGVLVEPVYE